MSGLVVIVVQALGRWRQEGCSGSMAEQASCIDGFQANERLIISKIVFLRMTIEAILWPSNFMHIHEHTYEHKRYPFEVE